MLRTTSNTNSWPHTGRAKASVFLNAERLLPCINLPLNSKVKHKLKNSCVFGKVGGGGGGSRGNCEACLLISRRADYEWVLLGSVQLQLKLINLDTIVVQCRVGLQYK